METKRLTNRALAAALAAAVGAGVAVNAHAGALATSIHQLTNFKIIDRADNQPLEEDGSADDFESLVFTSGADASASLNGSSTSTSGTASAANPLDLPPQCVGNCPAFANNAFPMVSSGLGDPSTNFSAGDTNQTGSPIAGLGAPVGATVESGAYVSLAQGDQDGSATANNDLSSSFKFKLTGTGTRDLRFEFDADSYQEAFTSSDQQFPADANASSKVSFEIATLGGTTLVDWDPNGVNNPSGHIGITDESDPFTLNTDLSRNAPINGVSTGPHALGSKSSGSFFAEFTIPEDQDLTLTARLNTDTDATTVPAPGALALMGIGLIGMGAASTRRRRSTFA